MITALTKTAFIQTCWQRWLSRRLPASSSITLAHKSIFILPTGFGLFWLFIVVLLFLFGTNYQNNLVIGLSLLLLSVFNTCIIYSYRNLAGMSLEAKTGPYVYAGESVIFPVELSATQHQYQVTLGYPQNLPQTIAHVDRQKLLTLLSFKNEQRGWVTPGRLKVESRYPLGLCRAWSNVDLANPQIVFAKPIASEPVLTQQLNQDDPSSTDRGRAIVGVEEFQHLKPYIQGESLNQVAWKQLAQGRGMLTKAFSQPASEPQWLVLDPNNLEIEKQLSQLTWAVNQLDQSGQIFGLILPNQTLAPNHGQQHRVDCLKAIATYPNLNRMQAHG
ncbi:DUF58 domain-containing protein [Shewanella sp. Isolate11]|uniref:DUF58 domain-containing protein n=1 Tax=Shewanella sp. Isolate11 TaxID=2908530 RepID=UPI001EFCAE78|nr:DUF58 domain-containing protein [Shewanella sp. Isolate11]MCG9696534.1 DUF58 domain-containing protein [Shewanella sp. Isolate11]